MYTELINDNRHLTHTPLQQMAENERRAELELELAKVKAETRVMDDIRHRRKLQELGYNKDALNLDIGEFPQVHAADMG
ncbi:MAG: hypothetical protein K8R08_08150 [Methanosarcinales archaeon]|nr:hypothetical protein [Methanosarcinales archaeon]